MPEERQEGHGGPAPGLRGPWGALRPCEALWAERGIGSVALDMRGHGRASDRAASARASTSSSTTPPSSARPRVRARRLSEVLFGHSFGGLVAALSVLEQQRTARAHPDLPVLGSRCGAGREDSPGRSPRPPPSSGSRAASKARRSRTTEKPRPTTRIRSSSPRRARAGSRDRTRAAPPPRGREADLSMPLYVVFGTADPVVAGGRRSSTRARATTSRGTPRRASSTRRSTSSIGRRTPARWPTGSFRAR